MKHNPRPGLEHLFFALALVAVNWSCDSGPRKAESPISTSSIDSTNSVSVRVDSASSMMGDSVAPPVAHDPGILEHKPFYPLPRSPRATINRPTDAFPDRPHPVATAQGRLLLNWPSQLNVNESYLLHLVITCNRPFSALTTQLDQLLVTEADTSGQHRQTHTAERIELGRVMKADLTRTGNDTNDTMIQIAREPTGENGVRTLDLATDTTVSWSWYITPKSPGRIEMTVSMTRVEEGDTKLVYHYPITILGKEPTLFEKITTFLTGANAIWALVSTGIVGAIIKYVSDRWSKKKEPVAK